MDNNAFEHETEINDFYLINEKTIQNKELYNLTTKFDDILNKKLFLEFQNTDISEFRINETRVSTSSLLTESDYFEFKIDDESLYILPKLNNNEFYDVNTTDSFDEDVSLLKRNEYTLQEIVCISEVENMDVVFTQKYRNKQNNK